MFTLSGRQQIFPDVGNVFFFFSAEGMKAGNYGNLLVQIEQPRGEYAVTIAFLRLITTLVKVIISYQIRCS